VNIKKVMTYLINGLPNFTEEFTEYLSAVISSCSVIDARTIRVNTATAHGLSVADTIKVIDTEIKNDIESIAIDYTTATVTFKNNHDFTYTPDADIDGTANQIEIAGNDDTDWNGEFDIIDVRSDKTIDITAPSETEPTSFGYVWEALSMGANGLMTVSAVDTLWFEYEIPEDYPNLPVASADSCRNAKVIKGVRVGGAGDPERAVQIYTDDNSAKKSWAFVMFPDEKVSKDQQSNSDAVAQFSVGDESRQSIMINFDVLVLLATTSVGAVDEVEKACGEIRNALIKSIVGIRPVQENSDRVYKTVYNGSNVFVYNTAVYARMYSFQTVFDITFRETAESNSIETVALREAIINLAVGGTDTTKVIANSEIV